MESEDSIFKIIENSREEFGVLLLAALKDGLTKVADVVSSKKYIGTYYEWPSIYFRENGLPNLSSSSFEGAKEYRKCFGPKEDEIIESDIESFSNFLEFVTSNEDLESRFIMKQWKEIRSNNFPDVRTIFIYSIVKNAIERYIHVHDSFEYNEDKAKDIIYEVQNFIFLDTLSIDIVIPILFVNFDFDSYTLSDGIEVRRLTEKEHLARYNIKSYNVSVHDSVLSSATHALVLKDWEVENSPCTMDFNNLENIRAYPIELINKFFASIRLVKNISTGYAQVFSLAKSWISHCKADLPHVVGTTTRSYPASFEDYYWNIESVPLVGNSEMNTIGKIFNLLVDSEENSIDLSVKRLNQCLVRDSEEDSVLDATIALETLLSDDGNQEMTHKLAMRVGALVNLDSSFGKTPQQAFKDIKSIYAYRSAIVHGSKKLDKKRFIKLEDNKETTTHSLAVEYLRFVLKVLLENPKYRDPKLVDSELLLGGINA
ncbi:HEPN domain-containing protein [Shewanella algae]|uniref:HEPN domain-containing protein n=1 Tax=Shewanella algae TaxID=38313 RepID=UPI001183E9E4|nr:HEPN domain-containing protein [Shewanella algae]TVL52132.1 hypothetical protein AYI98_04870 [Shewanella algae]